MKINENFLKIESSYLFSTVAKKQREYQAAHPEADVIRLSIGDVTKPLAPAVIKAMHKAVDEMADEATFRGYPPEYGYDFILDAIQKHDYTAEELTLPRTKFSFQTALRATAAISEISLLLTIRLLFATLFILCMLIQTLWQAEAEIKTKTDFGQILSICHAPLKIILHLIFLRKFPM